MLNISLSFNILIMNTFVYVNHQYVLAKNVSIGIDETDSSIISIATSLVRLHVIPVIMYVKTFKTDTIVFYL